MPMHEIEIGPVEIALLTSSIENKTLDRATEFDLHADNQALCLIAGSHLPSGWDSTTPRARNKLTVIDCYLNNDQENPKSRLESAFEDAADRLDKTENQVRRSCGKPYEYRSPIRSNIFLNDLEQIEADYVAYKSEK